MGTVKYLHNGKVVTVPLVNQSESPLKILDGGKVKGIPLGDTGPIKILVNGKVRCMGGAAKIVGFKWITRYSYVGETLLVLGRDSNGIDVWCLYDLNTDTWLWKTPTLMGYNNSWDTFCVLNGDIYFAHNVSPIISRRNKWNISRYVFPDFSLSDTQLVEFSPAIVNGMCTLTDSPAGYLFFLGAYTTSSSATGINFRRRKWDTSFNLIGELDDSVAASDILSPNSGAFTAYGIGSNATNLYYSMNILYWGVDHYFFKEEDLSFNHIQYPSGNIGTGDVGNIFMRCRDSGYNLPGFAAQGGYLDAGRNSVAVFGNKLCELTDSVLMKTEIYVKDFYGNTIKTITADT